MKVPGSNLLKMALKLVATQTVQYRTFTGNAVLADGSKVPGFAAPVEMRGSFQPMSANNKKFLGLDLNTNYANFYVSADVLGLDRDRARDRLTYAGKTYQIMNVTDWFSQDGWKNVQLVEIRP